MLMKSDFEEAFSYVRFAPNINPKEVFLYYDNGGYLVKTPLDLIQGVEGDLILTRTPNGEVKEIPKHRFKVIRIGDRIIFDRRRSYTGDPTLPDKKDW